VCEPGALSIVRISVMQSPQLVIFDCDGVLVDSEVISNDVLARQLTAEGLPTTLAQARRDYQGLLLEQVARDAGARLGRELGEEWISRYEQVRSEEFRRELRPVAGAAELVQRIRGAGIEVCVASQGRLAKTRLSLELTGLAAHFSPEALFSAEQVARGKPFPDLFLYAAATIGAPTSRCVVIEDTASGVRAAAAARMRVLGYAPDSDAHALSAAGAELVMSLAEVPRLLGFA